MLRALLLLSGLTLPLAAAAISSSAPAQADWSYVERTLKRHNFDPRFRSEMKKKYEGRHFSEVLELNVLLFLRTTDFHSIQISEEAIQTIQEFSERHSESLKSAEARFGVPGDVISSLLWLESRFGQNPGRFHVASVFMHLLQAERAQNIKALQRAAKKFKAQPNAKDFSEIAKRSRNKARWAIVELKALQKIFLRDRNLASNLRGSFAGAFGMPQFLPSSYAVWAKAERGNQTPDLYKTPDAIHSVAFYLRGHGWRPAHAKSQTQALFRYNNSHDYVAAILTMAKRVKSASDSKRLPAAKSTPWRPKKPLRRTDAI